MLVAGRARVRVQRSSEHGKHTTSVRCERTAFRGPLTNFFMRTVLAPFCVAAGLPGAASDTLAR